MQLVIHVSHEYNELPVADKILFGAKVVEIMTAHATTFVTPDPPLADVTAASGALATANIAFLGNPDLRQGVKEADEEWMRVMNRLADYVDHIANGVGSIIDISGFKQTKSESNPAVRPNVLVSDMYTGRTKGTAHIDNKASHGAKGYLSILSTKDVTLSVVGNQITFHAGTSVISIVVDTKRSADFVMMPSHIDVDGRAAAFNSAGLGDLNGPNEVSIP